MATKSELGDVELLHREWATNVLLHNIAEAIVAARAEVLSFEDVTRATRFEVESRAWSGTTRVLSRGALRRRNYAVQHRDGLIAEWIARRATALRLGILEAARVCQYRELVVETPDERSGAWIPTGEVVPKGDGPWKRHVFTQTSWEGLEKLQALIERVVAGGHGQANPGDIGASPPPRPRAPYLEKRSPPPYARHELELLVSAAIREAASVGLDARGHQIRKAPTREQTIANIPTISDPETLSRYLSYYGISYRRLVRNTLNSANEG
jgi:hypothetical protein